jgi:hypothetical protein
MRRTVYRTALAAVAALGILWASAVRAPAAEDLSQKVQAAKTPADHEALAADYDKLAAAARAEAAVHRKMAEAYKGMSATAIGKAGGLSAMPQHCESLVKTFEEQAKMYDALAAAERALSKAK